MKTDYEILSDIFGTYDLEQHENTNGEKPFVRLKIDLVSDACNLKKPRRYPRYTACPDITA